MVGNTYDTTYACSLARDVLGVDSGINRCSNAYKSGEYGSLALEPAGYVCLKGVPLAMFARRQASSGGGLLGDLLDPVMGSLLPVEVFYYHTDHLGRPGC